MPDSVVFIGCIAVALLVLVVLPELSRRAHLARVRRHNEGTAKILKPRGWRGWRDDGEGYDEAFR